MKRIGLIVVVASLLIGGPGRAELRVGFGRAEITPELKVDRPVYIAGYGPDRRATGVHDPLFARALVLDDGMGRIALVSVDLIGLSIANTRTVRASLPSCDDVVLASTHNHEGPDTIGLWGPAPQRSGVDPDYIELVERRVIEAVGVAIDQLAPAEAIYGTAISEELLADSRRPIVKDPVLRALRFYEPGAPERSRVVVVQWNCHPENLGSRNTLITADFPYATIDQLEATYDCPVLYLTGAIGGLMSAPERTLRGSRGQLLSDDGDFEFAEVYGRAVADLAESAIEDAEPIDLTPIRSVSKTVRLPLENPYYRLAFSLGVIERTAYTWDGDSDGDAPAVNSRLPIGPIALETEVALIRCGDLDVACIPGELYPELVHGRFEEPPVADVDYPNAPLEPTVDQIVPSSKRLILGLANDEIGYIIPKRQWDDDPPYAYGRTKPQYGEINSVGPEVAPILMQALRRCAEELADR